MPISETQRELIVYLDRLTLTILNGDIERFTTAAIANALSVSRNLASHYLNEMVRARVAIKAGNRPVYYLHRRTLERVFQTKLETSSFDSIDTLLHRCGIGTAHDFSQVIGFESSLQTCVECCRAAINYPHGGLSLIIEGDHGTGKAFLAARMFEYGKSNGTLDEETNLIEVDCSRYTDLSKNIAQDYISQGGFRDRANGGIVFLRDADNLSEAQASELLSVVSHEPSEMSVSPSARIVISLVQLDTPSAQLLMRHIPMKTHLPRFNERPLAERETFVRHFFKSEGSKLATDVRVSRGTFRMLASSEFQDNIRELKLCITNCCADAYLNKKGNCIQINVAQLPTAMFEAYAGDRRNDDGELIDVNKINESESSYAETQALESIINAYEAYRLDDDIANFMKTARRSMQDYEDALLFNDSNTDARLSARERIIWDILCEAGDVHGLVFTRRDAWLVAREVATQVRPHTELTKWCFANSDALNKILTVLGHEWNYSTIVQSQIISLIQSSLGIMLDDLGKLLLLIMVRNCAESSNPRSNVGIILSHGFATASSIADVANRVLGTRVFEALDMHYDQQITDIIGPLRSLLTRYAYCDEIVILVDMGSLEQIDVGLGELSGCTLGVVTGVSTGLAVEIGTGLLLGRSVQDVIATAVGVCESRYKIINGRELSSAILFCSEGGISAAEKIKALVAQSFESEVPLRLIACDAERLATNGRQDTIFSRYVPVAIIGTVDPHIDRVPFIALEDLISNEAVDSVAAVLSPFLDEKGLAAFQQNLIKTLTLRNVVESITILNPTRLFDEIERSVERLEMLIDHVVAERVKIGLYVHLCCMVERLVTRTPIKSYGDDQIFFDQHHDFIAIFRRSFSDITDHYRVEIPISEIAYVYDYIWAPRLQELGGKTQVQEDE